MGRHPAATGLSRRLGSSERGSVAIWVAITTPALLLLLMLLVDGGAKFTAAEQASAYAAEAARAATIAVGPQPTPGDARAAVTAADAYLASAGVHGTVTAVGPATVRVSVTVSRTGPISDVRFAMTRTATAQLLIGVETGHTA